MVADEADDPTNSMSRTSSSFELLDTKVQRWIWSKGWDELHDIQEKAIPAILRARDDVILAAATAAGKTEAAFLPIVSRLLEDRESPEGFEVIYISPLRALINDQFGRIEDLCSSLEINVWRWHGDVAASHKRRARAKPCGIVLITPESLEALFVLRGIEAPRIFRQLKYVVIDELHAFMGSDRGKQLQSLLQRIDVATRRHVVRIGLSATLPNLESAANFMMPGEARNVLCLESASSGAAIRLQIRGYVNSDNAADGGTLAGTAEIARDLFVVLRQHRNLIFTNSRRNVELYASKLEELCDEAQVPLEFFPHHGSLSKELREFAETRMKDEDWPASIVCTSTLELGIDVGAIDSVAQVESPYSVSSLRQRAGRSGRRAGQASILRMYVSEQPLHPKIHLEDALRPNIVRSIALVQLMLAKWNEPPNTSELHLSALIHQVLALIRQFGGVSPSQVWSLLVKSGCFGKVSEDLFKDVLRDMGVAGLVEQASDGTLLPGPLGERVTERYDFFAVFQTPEEYRLVHESRALGTLPLENELWVDALVIFGGKRWQVTDVDVAQKVVHVKPAKGGLPPRFGGEIGPTHERVVHEMRSIYEDSQSYSFLNERALELLAEGRKAYADAGLRHRRVTSHEGKFLLFTWSGGRENLALALCLSENGVKAAPMQLSIEVEDTDHLALRNALRHIADNPTADAIELAHRVPNRLIGKYDGHLSERLQSLNFASARLVTRSMPSLARELLSGFHD